MSAVQAPSAADWQAEADLERRFGALRRLWGDAAYTKVRAARIAVVGVGGVGSWCAEALVRCGVAELVLIDLDQISESNINRQIQALGSTVGAAKVDVLKQRLLDIHPGCVVHAIEAFVEADNWPALLPVAVDVLIDACDQGRAKLLLAQWALQHRQALVTVGAAGGKTRPQSVEVDDLAHVTHDPLLARLRQQVRRTLAQPDAPGRAKGPRDLGVSCVFSREPIALPDQACEVQGGL
ncbi:MAG: ThiF family adenylyltransferase, partial [Leptothrix sp. (in: b-proteobacteria)]